MPEKVYDVCVVGSGTAGGKDSQVSGYTVVIECTGTTDITSWRNR
jgi:hypothetical protein